MEPIFDPLAGRAMRLVVGLIVAAVLFFYVAPLLSDLGVEIPVVSSSMRHERAARHVEEREWVRSQERP